jgi:iron complex outermembrane recepter protein
MKKRVNFKKKLINDSVSHINRGRRNRPFGLLAMLPLSFTTVATWAADDIVDNKPLEFEIEEIAVTGSRVKGRVAMDSAVPVDVFNAEALKQVSFTDTNDALRTLIPSYNVNRYDNNDGATHIRPATMRGLSPDHTLVLINGKRRHRSALVVLDGKPSTAGAQPVDLSKIPMSAIKRVEVLRDGAAAQYGSDAIAGVMHFILKDDAEGGSVKIQGGQFFEGDGEDFNMEANIGLPLTQNGFLNLTASYTDSSGTSRGIQRADAQALIDAGVQNVPTPAMTWGNPEVESFGSFWNAGIDISEGTQFYFFGNYSEADSWNRFYFRNPESSSAYKESEYDESPDHPGLFDLTQRWSGGFTPDFNAQLKDFSNVIGFKHLADNGLWMDLGLRYAQNKIEYYVENTVNPSMGNASPTSFYSGSLKQEESAFTADFSYAVENDLLSSDLNLAAGLEYREETYIIGLGDTASWQAGPLLDLPIGASGFPGNGPISAGENSRDNISLYLDAEADVTQNLLIGAAVRYEDYSDFGSTVTGKFSARYDFTDQFALRGAISTGFRAPTVGQIYTTNTTAGIADDGVTLVDRGTFPSIDPSAVYFGGKALEPEESTNFSLGAVFSLENIDLTVDFYHIEVTDRISLSDNFVVTEEDRVKLAEFGVANAATLGTVRYFSNVFDTTTQGVDIVANYDIEWDASATNLVLSYNHNDLEVTGGQEKLSDFKILGLEEQDPKSRMMLTVTHNTDNFSYMVRGTRYGSWTDPSSTVANIRYRDSAILMDAEVTYHYNEAVDISLGGRNILDEFPESDDLGRQYGRLYVRNSPFGYNGGFYYLNARYHF